MSATSWEQSARCSTIGPAIFFPEGQGRRFTAAAREAKAVCGWCPVRELCLDRALELEGTADRHKRAGIWGGTTPNERAAIARRRRQAA